MLVGIREERDDLLLLARIERASECRAAASLDLLDQRRELVAVSPADEQSKTFGGEFLRDLGRR